MKKRNEIRQLIINLLNSWPAKHYFFYKGWILRFTDGVTSRANSVFPLNYYGSRKTIEYDIDVVEKAYKKYGLPVIYTIYDCHKPNYLSRKLIRRNYRKFDFTISLGGNVNDLNIKHTNDNYEYSFQNERTSKFSEFLSQFSSRSKEQQNIITKITQRIKILKKCFIVVKSQNLVIGTLMGVLDLDGYLYLADIFVSPNYRNQGIAKSMIYKVTNEWVNPKYINMIWLQVEVENENAINFYENIGLKELYSYYYLTNS
ncbi:MAG: GNAT family N-acetyltransferase [Candidatus Hodarchaeota archaeon]